MKTRLDETNRMRKLMGLPLIKEEKEVVTEQVGIALGIMLWRQTAKSKANRLSKHIKQNLRDRGIKSNNIEGGNLNKLLSCINGHINSEGEIEDGKKSMDKGLVRKKAKSQVFQSAFNDFKSRLDPKIVACSVKFGLTDEESKILSDVIISTISDFANKKLRL